MPDGNLSSPPAPPGILAPLVAAIGEDGVLRLIEERGGTVVYIRKKLQPTRGLGRELKLDRGACDRLSKLAGDGRLKVPLCRAWRAKLYKWHGFSYTQIALKLRVTKSAVWRILKDADMTNGNQMSLPL